MQWSARLMSSSTPGSSPRNSATPMLALLLSSRSPMQ